jgi:hypothetical protein
MAEYETQITRTIWDNHRGTNIVVKPDTDGCLIEITQDFKTLTFTVGEARLLAPALLATAMEVEESE